MFLEDSTFEIMELENDILYESIHLDILKSSIMEDIYIESDDSFFDKVKKFIGDIIEKIKKFFSNAKDAITNFFTRKNIDDKLDKIETAIKENPELGKQQISIPNYDDMHELYKKTISDLEGKVEDTEKTMAKYRKQRNTIMKAGAVTTVTLAAGIGIVRHIGKKKQKELEFKNKELQAQCMKDKKEIEDLEQEVADQRMENTKKAEQIESQKRIIRDQQTDIQTLQTRSPIRKFAYRTTKALDHVSDKKKDAAAVIAEKKTALAARAEVARDITVSTGTEIKDTAMAVISHPLRAVSTVKKGVHNIGEILRKATSGELLASAKKEQQAGRDAEIERLKSICSQLKEIINSGNYPKGYGEAECKKLLNTTIKQLETLGEYITVPRQ